MPCYNLDGDEIACMVGGQPNPDIAFGNGLDYEQAKAAALSAARGPATYKPSASDPYDPTFGSAQSRVALLGESGFQWRSGEGPNALWLAPDGRLVPELTALKMASDPTPPTPPKPSTALTFEEQMRLRAAPSVSSSTSYHQPNELDYAKEARDAAESRAEIARRSDESAREDVKLRVLIEKERVAAESGRRAEQREIARDIEATQYRRDQAVARVQELNTAAMNRAAEFNASASETAAQRTEAARSTNLSAQRQNAVDIANFQQMPGDIARLGAYLQARQGDGGSPISTAIGQGENFITDQSLAPLGTLLDTRSELSRPAIFSAARYEPAVMGQQPGIFNREQAPITSVQGGEEGVPNAAAAGLAAFLAANPGLSPEARANLMASQAPTLNPATGQYEQGGQVVNVLDAQGNLTLPSAAAASPMAPQQQAQPQGIFNRQAAYQPMSVEYGAPTQANPGARIFQRQAAATARERSGLRGDLTPIAFSDPGTDPYLAELAAGVTAAERGVDTRLFERERQRLAPRQMPVFSRTR